MNVGSFKVPVPVVPQPLCIHLSCTTVPLLAAERLCFPSRNNRKFKT